LKSKGANNDEHVSQELRRERRRRRRGRVKCHGPLTCPQQSYGTLSERVRPSVLGGGGGGVQAPSLAVTDGFSPLFSLSFPLRLSHISNRVLCLHELIKDGRKQREDTSKRAACICHSRQSMKELNACSARREFHVTCHDKHIHCHQFVFN